MDWLRTFEEQGALTSITSLANDVLHSFSQASLEQLVAQLEGKPKLPQHLCKVIDECVGKVLAELVEQAADLPLLQEAGDSVLRFLRIACSTEDHRTWISVIEPLCSEVLRRHPDFSNLQLEGMATAVEAFSKSLRTLEDRVRSSKCRAPENQAQLQRFMSLVAQRLAHWKGIFHTSLAMFLKKLVDLLEEKTAGGETLPSKLWEQNVVLVFLMRICKASQDSSLNLLDLGKESLHVHVLLFLGLLSASRDSPRLLLFCP